MSSDEDFSLVGNSDQNEDTLEGVQALIKEYQKKYSQILEEQKEIKDSTVEYQDMTKQFKKRTEKLTEALKKEEISFKEQIASKETGFLDSDQAAVKAQVDFEKSVCNNFLYKDTQAKLDALRQEKSDLMEELQRIEAEIEGEDSRNAHLRERADVFSKMPEKKFVFSGKVGKANDTEDFEMKAHITYPMEEGTALITFEEEDVAIKILEMRKHKVDLGEECRIIVEAQPVHLMMPSLVEIDTEICPQRVLISNLPKMDTETMQNKLEIHFSKSKNGGGEVDCCEFLPDSGTVVITFVEKNIAERLTETEHHEVKFAQTKHKVRVTPFINGKITNLETRTSMCCRTVLLTGIPNVMDQETLQDMLEIHFQKNGNGGGEIEAFLYNPLGQHTLALFSNVSSEDTEE